MIPFLSSIILPFLLVPSWWFSLLSFWLSTAFVFLPYIIIPPSLSVYLLFIPRPPLPRSFRAPPPFLPQCSCPHSLPPTSRATADRPTHPPTETLATIMAFKLLVVCVLYRRGPQSGSVGFFIQPRKGTVADSFSCPPWGVFESLIIVMIII